MLMSFTKGQVQHHLIRLVLANMQIMHLDLEYFVEPQHTQEGHCIGSLQKSSYSPTTPLAKATQACPFTRAVRTNCPVFREVIMMVQF